MAREVVTPVLTIDGPSGSGKGTIATRVATRLGWSVLDSGALYRVLAYRVRRDGVDFGDRHRIAEMARSLSVRFDGDRILLEGEDVSTRIRSETAANDASRVAALPEVREALLGWQRQAATGPGLVADGRDMGTVVFPRAVLKVFLTASPEERARRRYKQLKEKGIDATMDGLTAEIEARDARDRNRRVSPLLPAADAMIIDSTTLDVDAVVDKIIARLRATLGCRD